MEVQKDPEQNEIKHLRQYADVQAQRILEIGCGDGRLTWRYATEAGHVVGIDLERDDLRVARIETPSDLADRLGLAQADSTRLPFRAGSYDLAILAWSF